MPTLSDINHQHDHLFMLAHNIRDRIADGTTSTSVVISMISGLIDYAAYHFAQEKEMMKDLNYFDYEGHTETHDMFIKLATKLYNTTLEDPTYLADVIRILTNWLDTHIDVEMFLFARAVSRLKKL